MSSRRREQRAWYVYDWANSAFSTTVVTALFGPYLTELVRVAAAPNGRVALLGIAVDYRAVWEWLMALSVATQAVAMPLLGAIADHGRLRKPLLAVMAYIRGGATVAMYWLQDGRWLLGCALFLVANLAFGNSILLYNAFLPEISGAAERDAVSSKGWALGYAGGGLVLLATVILASGALGRAFPPPITTVNFLAAVALLAPISRWSDGAGRALALIAGLVSFLTGLGRVDLRWIHMSRTVSDAFRRDVRWRAGRARSRGPGFHRHVPQAGRTLCSVVPVTT